MYREEQLFEELSQNLPEGLAITVHTKANSLSDEGYDGFIDINMPDGRAFPFVFQIRFRPRKEQLLFWEEIQNKKNFSQPGLLVCDRMTPALEKYCIERGIHFLDSAGNASITVPGLFLRVSGRKNNAFNEEPSRMSSGVMKLLFVLLSEPGTINTNYRQLATLAGISLGMVSKAFDYLESKRLYRQSKQGRRLIDPETLTAQWIREYAVELRPKLKTLVLEENDNWRKRHLEPGECWGGEAAANILSDSYLHPEHIQLFTPLPLSYRKESLGLRSHPKGNFHLTSAFWGEDFTPTTRGIVLLSIAELMASQDDRNIETAGLLNDRYLQLKTATLFGH
jgi:hypothetical protein